MLRNIVYYKNKTWNMTKRYFIGKRRYVRILSTDIVQLALKLLGYYEKVIAFFLCLQIYIWKYRSTCREIFNKLISHWNNCLFDVVQILYVRLFPIVLTSVYIGICFRQRNSEGEIAIGKHRHTPFRSRYKRLNCFHRYNIKSFFSRNSLVTHVNFWMKILVCETRFIYNKYSHDINWYREFKDQLKWSFHKK